MDPIRTNIAIAGRMNAGKSTFLNALTQNALSIVSNVPGTTADAKVALMEIHGLGATRLFDTAGLDERGELGEKKRQKTLKILDQADVIVHVKNTLGSGIPDAKLEPGRNQRSLFDEVLWAQRCDDELSYLTRKLKKPTLIVLNDPQADGRVQVLSQRPAYKEIRTNVTKADAHELAELINSLRPKRKTVDFLPRMLSGAQNAVLLVIPLDAQSPKLRLLRPQQQAIEQLLSAGHTVICYREDLQKARGKLGAEAQAQELNTLKQIVSQNNVRLVITDSQAIDTLMGFTVPTTTFSVMQSHWLLGEELFRYTTESLEKIKDLQKLERPVRVIIAEACHHDKITAHCDDIGTAQIPKHLKRIFPQGVEIHHAFGKDDVQLDKQADLVIHCGGCMISAQQMQSRARHFAGQGIPVLSYGTFLSFAAGGLEKATLVLKPWE